MIRVDKASDSGPRGGGGGGFGARGGGGGGGGGGGAGYGSRGGYGAPPMTYGAPPAQGGYPAPNMYQQYGRGYPAPQQGYGAPPPQGECPGVGTKPMSLGLTEAGYAAPGPYGYPDQTQQPGGQQPQGGRGY